jgi:hypothetical protein
MLNRSKSPQMPVTLSARLWQYHPALFQDNRLNGITGKADRLVAAALYRSLKYINITFRDWTEGKWQADAAKLYVFNSAGYNVLFSASQRRLSPPRSLQCLGLRVVRKHRRRADFRFSAGVDQWLKIPDGFPSELL